MYKNLLIKVIIVTLVAFTFGYVLAWGLYSYTVASLASDEVTYTYYDLKVDDRAYNGLGTYNHLILQDSFNVIQPDRNYSFTGIVK